MLEGVRSLHLNRVNTFQYQKFKMGIWLVHALTLPISFEYSSILSCISTRWFGFSCNLNRTCLHVSRDMRFPTMWYVRSAKSQISLRIRAVWSEPLLVACIFYECWATDWTLFGVSKLKMRMHRLVWVYTCQNATLLEITCHGSFIGIIQKLSFLLCASHGIRN